MTFFKLMKTSNIVRRPFFKCGNSPNCGIWKKRERRIDVLSLTALPTRISLPWCNWVVSGLSYKASVYRVCLQGPERMTLKPPRRTELHLSSLSSPSSAGSPGACLQPPPHLALHSQHTHAHTHTHVCAHTHTFTHMCTHTHMHTHTCTHTYTPTHTDTHTLTCTHMCTHTHMYTHSHTLTHTYTHSCAHTLTHSHAHTHTHAHAHSHTHACILSHTHTHTHTQRFHSPQKFLTFSPGTNQKPLLPSCSRNFSRVDPRRCGHRSWRSTVSTQHTDIVCIFNIFLAIRYSLHLQITLKNNWVFFLNTSLELKSQSSHNFEWICEELTCL